MPDTTRRSTRTIRSDADAVGLVTEMLTRANRRQCWMLFVAQDRRTIDLIMPIDDIPRRVDDDTVSHLAETMARVFRQIHTRFVLVVWERPGGPDPSHAEWEWVHAVAASFADSGVVIRGQMLLHDGGVAWLESEQAPALPAVSAAS